jgi:hypothetical protein
LYSLYLSHNKRVTSFILPDIKKGEQQIGDTLTKLQNMEFDTNRVIRKCGWLNKLNRFKMWNKRFFVLTDHILDYYSGM